MNFDSNKKKNNDNIEIEENKEVDAQFFKQFGADFKTFLHSIVSIKNEVDIEATTASIKKGIDFSGSSVWILVCSIIVASIGLNANSVAVIIGAMLISPLMGPIRGFGLAIATNDIKTLAQSLMNFGIMVIVSLLASWAYFWLTPLHDITPELAARTKPQVLDVMVAFFGGLAGIIAATSDNKSSAMTIIPGVAIATALMPPLCTAGFGLATHNWEFFFGAFYLFTLNSVFIALSTIVTVWMLRFPLVNFLNKKKEKKIKIIIFSSMLIVVIPSIIGFVNIIHESMFYGESKKYIAHLELENKNVNINSKLNYNDGSPEITLWIQGAYLDSREIKDWKSEIKNYNIGKVSLKIKQNEKAQYIDTNSIRLKTMYETKLSALNTVAEERDFLKHELIKLQSSKLNILELEQRIKLGFPTIKNLSFGEAYEINFTGKIDTLYLFNVHWGERTDSLERNKEMKQLKRTLRLELELKQLITKNDSNLRVLTY